MSEVEPDPDNFRRTIPQVGEACATAEFKVNLTRPITPRTGEVECGAQGRTLAVSEAALKDANGKLLAFGTETCSIFAAANLGRHVEWTGRLAAAFECH